MNRSPSIPINCRTPEEVWCGSPNYVNLIISCCPAYAHMNEGKLEPRARSCAQI